MIQFAAPWILWGALTAALPLLIHLFGKRKTQEVEFSSLRFLQSMQREQIRTLRIKQILLLILRTLFLLLLVFAFAGPRYAPSSAENLAHESAVVILDNTISTSSRYEDTTYLNHLISLAREIFAGDHQYETVVWTAFMKPEQPRVTSGNAPPEDFFAEITPVEGQFDFSTYLNDLRAWLDAEGYGNVDVYLLTDGQRTQYVSGESPALDPWGASRWLVVTPPHTLTQSGIQAIRFPTEMLQPGTEIPLEVTVGRSDSTAPATTAIQVYKDGQKIGQSLLNWSDEYEATETFEVPLRKAGLFQVEVALGADAYTADNYWFLNGDVPAGLDILLVSDSPGSRFFLETALQSIAARQSTISVASVSSGEVMEHLTSEVDVIVLSDAILSGPATEAMMQIVEGGTGLMVFPGNTIRQEEPYTLGGRLPVYSGYEQSEPGAFQQVRQVAWEHPVFLHLSKNASDSIQLPRVYQFFRLARGEFRPLMQIGGGVPLLAETEFQRGRIWFWTAAPSLEWTDLPRRGVFLPVIVRALYYLAGTQQRYQHQLTTGEPLVYSISDPGVGDRLTLITPSGQSVALPVTRGEARYPNTSQSGQYSLYDKEQVLALYSVNTSPAERDMRRITSNAWNVLFGEQLVGVFEPTGDDASLAGAGLTHGHALWQWAFLLALACVVGEMVVTRTEFSEERNDED